MSGEDELPSWDEFGAEQLDYEEGGEEGDEQVAAPTPLDDPGDPGDAPSCSSSSSSLQPAARAASGGAGRAAERNIGPSLPPGFDLGVSGGEDEEDEDPEDPGDPGDPGMEAAEDEAEIAPTLPSVGPSLPVDEPRQRVPGPAAAPAARRVYAPAAPPPEPEPRVRGAPAASAVLPARVVGPAMPPDLLPFEANGAEDHDEDETEEEDRREEEEEEEEDDDAYGPALPPGMNGGGGAAAAAAAGEDDGDLEMPTMDEEEDDDDVIGPMPARADGSEERAAEARRAYLKAEKEREDKKLKREEWMLQLPKKLNNYGLGARSFSKSNGGGEGSSDWTDGPGGSNDDKPGTSKETMEKMAAAQRDSAQERLASSLNSNRNESMLDAHERKRKAGEPSTSSAGGDGPPAVRRPFDIEKDMQVRGLKSTSTAEIKEKCGHLSSRFGNSGSQKYL